MSIRSAYSSLEILEARIAPANILVTTAGVSQTSVLKSKFSYGTAQTAAQTSLLGNAALAGVAAGATTAVLVDGILALDGFFGTPNNKYLAAEDPTLVKVEVGRALVYFTDLNHDNFLGADEITGVRVSNNFKGTFSVSVHGSIV